MKPEPRGTTCRTCGKQDHNAKACKGGKPKPKAVSAITTAVQAALSAQPAQNAKTAALTFNNFAVHHEDPKLGPGEEPHPRSYKLTGLAAQIQVAKSNSNTPVRIPILHMEFDSNLINWVETSPQPLPTLPVALQLHDQTYICLNVPKPMAHSRCQPQFGQAAPSSPWESIPAPSSSCRSGLLVRS